MTISVQLLHKNAVLPRRATPGSAAVDLSSCIDAPMVLAPGETALVATGLAIALPENYAAFIYARSGLGVRNGIIPANCVGVIDADYRGEIMVGLRNQSSVPFTVRHGDRIAQMVISPVATPEFTVAECLDSTARGAGGFGSSGR